MRKLLALIGLFQVAQSSSHAQTTSTASFNAERKTISKKGMTVLTTYAATNIVSGLILQGTTEGPAKYFHRMNALWNTVTLGIIGVGYLTEKKDIDLTADETIRQQKKTEKLFLINAGLDVLYTGAGLLLQEKAKTATTDHDKLQGYGRSLILQGAFLLAFDGLMYGLHRKHGKDNQINVGRTNDGIGVSFKF